MSGAPRWPPRSRRSTSARWDDLPDATLPWDRVAELAARQGIGEADVVWDLAAGMRPQPPKSAWCRKAPRSKRAPA